jgi:hypothetical protein
MPVKTSFSGIVLRPLATGTGFVAAMALLTGSAFAADPSCQLVAGATKKYLTIPTHIYTTETGSYTGGKPRNSESIYLIDKTYVQVNGRWRVSPVTPKMMLDDMKEAWAEADSNSHSTCQMVRDEAINGEAATLYSSHTETKDLKADSQIWISKSRGLPLKMEQSADTGGAAGKSHRVSRFEYTNVQAPPGVQ